MASPMSRICTPACPPSPAEWGTAFWVLWSARTCLTSWMWRSLPTAFILKTKNNRQISLVTDSMRGAGMPEGPSILGSRSHGMPVMISGGIANMMDHSGFAGSVATTDRLVRTMVQKAGLPLHEAVNMASLHPARLIHKDDEIGSIAVGKRADLVLLDEKLLTRRVFVDGHEITSH